MKELHNCNQKQYAEEEVTGIGKFIAIIVGMALVGSIISIVVLWIYQITCFALHFELTNAFMTFIVGCAIAASFTFFILGCQNINGGW